MLYLTCSLDIFFLQINVIYNVQEEDLQTALQVLYNLFVEDLLVFQN